MPILQSRLGSGGGGGGDATAANQTTQITEAQITNDYLKDANNLSVFTDPSDISLFKINSNGESVLKDRFDESVFTNTAQNSIFKDTLNESVFKDPVTGDTVFIAGGKTIADRVYESFILLEGSIKTNASTTVTSFTSTTLAGVAALLETFLQANPNIYIINISFSSAGVTQHDVLLTYNV
jgi:hypothetical protein